MFSVFRPARYLSHRRVFFSDAGSFFKFWSKGLPYVFTPRRSMGSWFNLTTQRDEGVALVATAGSEAQARQMIADRDEEWPFKNWPVKQEDG